MWNDDAFKQPIAETFRRLESVLNFDAANIFFDARHETASLAKNFLPRIITQKGVIRLPTFSKNTGDLFAELKTERDPQNFRDRNQNEFILPLHEYLTNLLESKGLDKKDVIAASQLNSTYAYHIFSGTRKNPSRPKLLALAIAMGLNLDEIQYLLRYAKQSPLYPRNPWDSTIIFAVEQKLSVMQTNELLYQLGETELLS